MKNNDLAIIYFSKDRPLQLDLTLRTNLSSKSEDAGEEFVLYKATDEEYKTAYNMLQDRFGWVTFIEESNFKENLLSIVASKKYVMFVVDDTVFTRRYSIRDIEDALATPGVLGFSLRLGVNTSTCYPYGDALNENPEIRTISGKNYSLYCWSILSFGDFAYPLELSSSVYHTRMISNILENSEYDNPNDLEWSMHIQTPAYRKAAPYLACYPISVAFSNPINKVQTKNNNRAGENEEYSPENLKSKFLQHYKIDARPFQGFMSTGCHQEVNIELVRVIDGHRL